MTLLTDEQRDTLLLATARMLLKEHDQRVYPHGDTAFFRCPTNTCDELRQALAAIENPSSEREP